jgi:hypothetical protein
MVSRTGELIAKSLRNTIKWETGSSDVEIAARIESRSNPFRVF